MSEVLGGQSFGGEVRRRRKAKGWSQRTLADHCRISNTYLSHLENDSQTASDELIARLADLLAPQDPVPLAECLMKLAGKLPPGFMERYGRDLEFRHRVWELSRG